jgi:hypothetical protein
LTPSHDSAHRFNVLGNHSWSVDYMLRHGLFDSANGSIGDHTVFAAILVAGTSVRFSYAASCNATSSLPPIPPIRFSTPPSRLTGVGAVRAIFHSDDNVIVTEGPGGIAKVSVGKVPTNLLRTRIALLRLQLIEQYNVSTVIDALESTKEMQGAVKSSGLYIVPLLHIQLLGRPVLGAPHVPAILRDVTIGQVLDLVARTFRGVLVTYGVCTAGPAPRLLLIK